MLALVTTPDGPAPMAIREVDEPVSAANQALIAVRAFSLNRGELASITRNGEGWIPGQDVSGGWQRASRRRAGRGADG